jgi:ribosomal-protein-alanine N-acetyltransferase
MPGAVFLEAERVTLHPLEEEHISFLYSVVNNSQVWQPMFDNAPYTREQEGEWIERMSEREDAFALLVCADGEPVGSIQLTNIDYTAGTGELGYFIAPDAQGNGYATEAVELLVQYAFNEERLHKLIAETYDFNEASRGLLEKIGFTEEGIHREESYVDGKFRDIHYYGLLDREVEF